MKAESLIAHNVEFSDAGNVFITQEKNRSTGEKLNAVIWRERIFDFAF
jgi:hypothetical protein